MTDKECSLNLHAEDLPPLINRQERRPNRSASIGARNSVSSFGSWDFSHSVSPSATVTHMHAKAHLHSPLSPTSPHFVYPALYNPSSVAHQYQYSEIDEKALTDEPEDLEYPRGRLYAPPLVKNNSSSDSASGSQSQGDVFQDDDEGSTSSSMSSPELAPSSLPGSSAATTPLSCSPAALVKAAYNGHEVAVDPPGGGQKNLIPAPHAFSRQAQHLSVTTQPPFQNQSYDVRQTNTSSRPHLSRPGSSPSYSRPDLGFPTLKRVTSAGSPSSNSASPPSSYPSMGPRAFTSPPPMSSITPEPVEEPKEKESKWRKLIKGSAEKVEKRKSTIVGKILEKASASSEIGGTLRGRRNS